MVGTDEEVAAVAQVYTYRPSYLTNNIRRSTCCGLCLLALLSSLPSSIQALSRTSEMPGEVSLSDGTTYVMESKLNGEGKTVVELDDDVVSVDHHNHVEGKRSRQGTVDTVDDVDDVSGKRAKRAG